jgi:phosphoglycolate phosphatase-like HAD superfamily hydrolase
VEDAEGEHERFRAEYIRILRTRLDNGARVRLLPGVKPLIERLAAIQTLTLGLLTGNYPETGRMKIQAARLEPDIFAIGAWGCEGTCRRDLPLVAIGRHAQATGRRLPGDRVVIVGDTPHDIDCAKANGCRSIGVATGQFTIESLRDSGADLAVQDLTATEAIVDWLRCASPSGHSYLHTS